MTYEVFEDDNFHYMEEAERLTIGEYETYEEAERICRERVDRYLTAELEQYPGISAEKLYDRYLGFGPDPFIRPEGDKFSAWNYAERRCKELCERR